MGSTTAPAWIRGSIRDLQTLHGQRGWGFGERQARSGIGGAPWHHSGDGSLRHVEAEHEKFAVNARRTPGRIFGSHPTDHGTDLGRRTRASDATATRLPSPVLPEPLTVPAHHRVGPDDAQRLLPPRPEATERDAPMRRSQPRMNPIRENIGTGWRAVGAGSTTLRAWTGREI